MMNFSRVLQSVVGFAAWLALIFCLAAPVWGTPITIPVGQTDDFQNGQLNNWLGGGSAMSASSQEIVPNGGPLGAGDQYLLISSGGSSNAPKLLASNTPPNSQWTGATIGQGADFSNITAIEMDLFMPQSDVDNGYSTIPIRLTIREGTSSNSAGYTYTTAFVLGDASHPAGQWWHAVFTLDASDFTSVSAGSPAHAPPAFNTLKANVQDFRILNASSNTTLIANGYSSLQPLIQFGIDNIVAVPEPRSIVLAAIAMAMGVGLQRRNCKRKEN